MRTRRSTRRRVDDGSGTNFLRPEDITWDTQNPDRAYFVTTDGLDDVIARKFSGTFWKEMAAGQSVAQAFRLGRMAIDQSARDFALLRPVDAGHDIYIAR